MGSAISTLLSIPGCKMLRWLLIAVKKNMWKQYVKKIVYTQLKHTYTVRRYKYWDYSPCLFVLFFGSDMYVYLHRFFSLQHSFQVGSFRDCVGVSNIHKKVKNKLLLPCRLNCVAQFCWGCRSDYILKRSYDNPSFIGFVDWHWSYWKEGGGPSPSWRGNFCRRWDKNAKTITHHHVRRERHHKTLLTDSLRGSGILVGHLWFFINACMVVSRTMLLNCASTGHKPTVRHPVLVHGDV